MIFSMVADALKIGRFPFGDCHAGIQLGNKLVGWYRNSLVSIGIVIRLIGFI